MPLCVCLLLGTLSSTLTVSGTEMESYQLGWHCPVDRSSLAHTVELAPQTPKEYADMESTAFRVGRPAVGPTGSCPPARPWASLGLVLTSGHEGQQRYPCSWAEGPQRCEVPKGPSDRPLGWQKSPIPC